MDLQITDGTTTVVLHGSSPTSPFLGAVYFPRDPGDTETVAETATIAYSGSNTALKTQVNHIERLLRQAANPRLPTVYIEYDNDVAGGMQRSPVVGGRVTWPDAKALRQVYNSIATGKFDIVWERAAYWEGAEVSLGSGSIVNGSASPYNSLALSAPAGSLPAPIKITITNASGAAISPARLYLSLDNTVGLTATESILAGSSTTWTGPADHSQRVYTLTIPTAVLAKLRGEEMQVVAGFTDLVESVAYIRASIYSTIGGVYQLLHAGIERFIGSVDLLHLGSLPIPPGGTATTDIALVLSVYSVNGGSATLAFVQLTPARNAIELRQVGYNVADGDSVVEDGLEGEAYLLDASDDRYDIIHRSGGPLMVQPGVDNRLYVLLYESTGDFDDTIDLDLAVTYRPRRATI